jgi:hypothetical protein
MAEGELSMEATGHAVVTVAADTVGFVVLNDENRQSEQGCTFAAVGFGGVKARGGATSWAAA